MSKLARIEIQKANALEDQAETMKQIQKKLETIEKKLDAVIVPQESSKAKGKAEAETKTK